jgi:hypothetical protein
MHAYTGHYRLARRWLSRFGFIHQESICGGAVVVGVAKAFDVHDVSQYVRHLVAKVHDAQNVFRLAVRKVAEQGAEAAIDDRR